MPRSTMARLITAVRGLIGDPGAPAPQFADDTIQAALDATRRDWRQIRLLPTPLIGATSTTYREYATTARDWEDTPILYDATYAGIASGYTFDAGGGRVTFAAAQGAPVYLSGQTYNSYAAAADLLDQWVAAGAGTQFEFSTDEQHFKVQQIREGRQALARRYRAQSQPKRLTAAHDERTEAGIP